MRQELENVYRRHRQGLFTLALAITRCPQSAEDAVHDAFVRLWRSGAGPDGEAVTYVYAAVRNAAIDQLRKAAPAGRPPVSIYNGQPDPQRQAMDAELARRLRQAVDDLPDAQRQAVVLRIYAGLSFQQMASVLDEPLPTVAARYRRALESLRQHAGSLT